MVIACGTRLGPYEIQPAIGAGGMGEVYKARDTRLDRIVAVKISKEAFGERFRNEALAVAALNHPHISTLHDVGPDYLVMEFVDGKPIRGPLSAAEAVRLAGEIAARSLERGQLVMDQERHTCTWKGEPVTLTVTEFLILHSLAQRPGVVKSRDSLMDAAYDVQVYVDDRTIDSHIQRLRKKFKMVDTDFDMIETLYGVGYRFREAA